MKISTRSRYAVRALIELADSFEGSPVTLREISRRQRISARYLENIMTLLEHAGIVIGSRGKRGGFNLARPSAEITLDDVFCATEHDSVPILCLKSPGLCRNACTCVTRVVWEDLNRSVHQVLRSYTLEKLVKMHRVSSPEMQDVGALHYYI
jgi:Rrf2 family protein